MTRLDIHNSQTPALCQSCEIRHKGMCGALSGEELLILSRHTRQVRHEAGAQLASEDMPMTSYANVMRGVVKLTKMLEDGRQQVVGLQFAPDFVGRIYHQKSDVSVEAASNVELCRVPRAALEQLVVENPKLERRLMEQTLRELDEARGWMVTLGRKTAAEKVASFLYLIATHVDPMAENASGVAAEFDLPLSRADIADFLGLTIETVSRQMTKLRTAGVIAIVSNRHITVPDITRLKARCG
jgi:CRP/FNR family transcriptional regulator